MFLIKLKKTCFYVFYLQINVFNIYGLRQWRKAIVIRNLTRCCIVSQHDAVDAPAVILIVGL